MVWGRRVRLILALRSMLSSRLRLRPRQERGPRWMSWVEMLDMRWYPDHRCLSRSARVCAVGVELMLRILMMSALGGSGRKIYCLHAAHDHHLRRFAMRRHLV